jgi:hypothetical protein
MSLDRTVSHSQKISPFQQTIKLAVKPKSGESFAGAGPKPKVTQKIGDLNSANQQQTPGLVSGFCLFVLWLHRLNGAR